jgi:hypothetical protein
MPLSVGTRRRSFTVKSSLAVEEVRVPVQMAFLYMRLGPATKLTTLSAPIHNSTNDNPDLANTD